MQLTMPQKKAASSRLSLCIAFGLLALGAIGAAVWFKAGRLTFDGELRYVLETVSVPAGGRIAALEVREGQRVRRGQVLLRLDDADLRRALQEERQRLNLLARALPLQYVRVPVEGGVGEEALTERLERRRRVEEEAWRRVQEASDNEAQAAVLYNRSAMLAARGKLPPEQRDAAEAALRAAQREKREALAAFERVSLSRAETSADVRSLSAAQAASGANRVPVDARLQAYQAGLERVAAAEAALASVQLLSPEDGLVSALLVRPGDTVRPMQAALELHLSGGLPVVAARLPLEDGKKLDTGRPCRVSPQDGSGKTLEGYIAAVVPDGARKGDPEGAAFVQVRVALLEKAGEAKGQTPAIKEGNKATVTVLLREALHKPQQAVLPETREGAAALPALEFAPDTPAGQAAPPSPPLSVQTPFGGPAEPEREGPARAAGPVTVTTGNANGAPGKAPEQDARAPDLSLPQLPPMQAPKTLTGSPYPDPRNNPSVARPEHLDREGDAPR